MSLFDENDATFKGISRDEGRSVFRYFLLKLPLSRKRFQLSPINSMYLQEVRIWCSGPMNMMNMNINS